MGLANRLTEPGHALEGALQLAAADRGLSAACLRSDRLSCYEQWGLSAEEAMRNEFRRGMEVLVSGESREGAQRFAAGRPAPQAPATSPTASRRLP